ncbi:D-Ala-D-Ala carboxypeptidase family metallohydrolase [Ewingella americana]|uniref:Peptidase M15A C-terminal domain-containing protein n=1 Tax=Ewingella americana TaxID=41202 RepID=A0A502GDD2_9GAMM|nr:D-Ala-D-Ala carboxypeptidase family metallohydrolase [Ewingella americana]TPG60109.1 hypothetical protein EAH77_16200 [Ewingella americana]
MSQLTKNFSTDEVGHSDTAIRLSIDNVPSPKVLASAQALAENVLQKIADHFQSPVIINSWYRGEALEREITKKGYTSWCANRGVAQNETSWKDYFSRKSHPNGEAADITVKGVALRDLYNWIKSNLKFDQLIIEGFKGAGSGWVHVSWKSEGANRNQAFEIPEG